MYYGLVMVGFINIKEGGDYTFFTASNDGSKLFVDNRELVNNDGPHGTIEKSGSVFLDKGRHLVELRYFQAGGGAKLKVLWQGPGFEKREMTARDLSGN